MSDYNSLKIRHHAYSEILESLIDNMPIPCSVVDTDEKFTLVNKPYEKMFSIDRGELLGRHYSCHVLPDEQSIHRVVLRERQPYSGVKKMGQSGRLVQVDGYPVFVEGELICSIAVMHEFSSVSRTMSALDNARQIIWNAESAHASYNFDDIVCQSEPMRVIVERAKKAAGTNVTILLRGDSGSGKEVFAHAIHQASARRHKRFVRVNCTALPEPLIESVLFGYASGAFTGAKKTGEVGLFEAAEGGTIFLDEIGDISLSLQTKLLRVLQEKEYSRVGDTQVRNANVRIITATNANLEDKIAKSAFRPDLYYRLNIFPLHIPPLRDRRDDIPPLVERFLRHYNREFDRNVERISEACAQKLFQYDWPGNVRELENAIARAIIDAAPGQTELSCENISFLSELSHEGEDLREDAILPYPPSAGQSPRLNDGANSYHDLFLRWERLMLEEIWRQEGRNKSRTARRLGISVRSVYEKIKLHHLD